MSTNCYICSEPLKLPLLSPIYLANEYSTHSKTIFFKLIEQILCETVKWNDDPKIRTESNLMSCTYCIRKLNEYDYALETIKFIRNDLVALYENSHQEFLQNEMVMIEVKEENMMNNITMELESNSEIMKSEPLETLQSPKHNNLYSDEGDNRELIDCNPDSGLFCKCCSLTFFTVVEYKKHKKTEEHWRNFQRDQFHCPKCDMKFKKSSNLDAHLKLKHSKINIKKRLRNLKFSKGNLRNRKSKNRDDLDSENCENQQNTSADEGSVKCNICKSTFKSFGSLNRHYMVHTGERPHVCPHCSKSFAQRYNMNLHIRSKHKNEKPFSCYYCSQKFTQSSNMKTHIEKKHPKKNNKN